MGANNGVSAAAVCAQSDGLGVCCWNPSPCPDAQYKTWLDANLPSHPPQVHLSNTLWLHKALNWKGILIEPTSNKFEELVHNRPNDVCVQAAVCSDFRTVHFAVAGDAVINGIWEFMSEGFKARCVCRPAGHHPAASTATAPLPAPQLSPSSPPHMRPLSDGTPIPRSKTSSLCHACP